MDGSEHYRTPRARVLVICVTVHVGDVVNSNLTSKLRTKWAGPVLNLAKMGGATIKVAVGTGTWSEVDSACAHAWQCFLASDR